MKTQSRSNINPHLQLPKKNIVANPCVQKLYRPELLGMAKLRKEPKKYCTFPDAYENRYKMQANNLLGLFSCCVFVSWIASKLLSR